MKTKSIQVHTQPTHPTNTVITRSRHQEALRILFSPQLIKILPHMQTNQSQAFLTRLHLKLITTWVLPLRCTLLTRTNLNLCLKPLSPIQWQANRTAISNRWLLNNLVNRPKATRNAILLFPHFNQMLCLLYHSLPKIVATKLKSQDTNSQREAGIAINVLTTTSRVARCVTGASKTCVTSSRLRSKDNPVSSHPVDGNAVSVATTISREENRATDARNPRLKKIWMECLNICLKATKMTQFLKRHSKWSTSSTSNRRETSAQSTKPKTFPMSSRKSQKPVHTSQNWILSPNNGTEAWKRSFPSL